MIGGVIALQPKPVLPYQRANALRTLAENHPRPAPRTGFARPGFRTKLDLCATGPCGRNHLAGQAGDDLPARPLAGVYFCHPARLASTTRPTCCISLPGRYFANCATPKIANDWRIVVGTLNARRNHPHDQASRSAEPICKTSAPAIVAESSGVQRSFVTESE